MAQFPFPSEEWFKRFGEVLNESPEYAEAAADWEGDVAFILTGDPARNIPEFIGYMDLWHGKCRGTKKLKDRGEVKAEIILSGHYDQWLEVIRKEMEPLQSIMQGHLQVEGNMGKLMRNVQAPLVMVDLITRIDTKFLY